jgi:lysophospholipase L1-like esterase
MNGEMPDSFDPKIWWLQLGLNDLGRMRCSEEIVVLGILRIVEEILAKKPNAKIVINSLLPMPDLRGGVKPGKNDFQDSFQTNGKKKKNNWMIRRMEALTTIEAATAEFDTFNLHDENRVLGHRKKKGREEKDGEKNKKDGERNKKGKRNPTMDAHKTEQKKFNPVTHKERKMPLWTSITAINEELKKFCTKHERVTFFDATDIFAENDGKFWVLKTDMITARGHPTPSGYSAWEVAIVERAKKLLDGSGIV